MTLPRPLRILGAALVALALSAAVHPALAAPPLTQQASVSDDRAKVIVLTVAVVIGSMLVLAIGYVYRRAAGIDKPPPVPLLEPGQTYRDDEPAESAAHTSAH